MSDQATDTDAKRIVFLGAGNMARSLIGGLLQQGFAPNNLAACDPIAESLSAIEVLGPVRTSTSNEALLADADVVVLAVKPQIMKQALTPLAALIQQRKPLLISIAAGISTGALEAWAGGSVPVVRCMPNTPALVRRGATALFANAQVSASQRAMASDILSAVGLALWVENEQQLDAVTAISGSGPAYFFLLMEAMQSAGQSLGLAPELTDALVLQTALGAATMACDSDVDVAELRRRVTSPNGTTQAALESFERDGLRATVDAALQAAAQRSVTLEQELCQ